MTIEYGLYDGTKIYAEEHEGQLTLPKGVFDEVIERFNSLLIWNADLEEETENLAEMNRLLTERTCDICGKSMREGYLVHDTEYYCSEECLRSEYTAEEYLELHECDEAYWTEWEEE